MTNTNDSPGTNEQKEGYLPLGIAEGIFTPIRIDDAGTVWAQLTPEYEARLVAAIRGPALSPEQEAAINGLVKAAGEIVHLKRAARHMGRFTNQTDPTAIVAALSDADGALETALDAARLAGLTEKE